jgi:hypothetical protein
VCPNIDDVPDFYSKERTRRLPTHVIASINEKPPHYLADGCPRGWTEMSCQYRSGGVVFSIDFHTPQTTINGITVEETCTPK